MLQRLSPGPTLHRRCPCWRPSSRSRSSSSTRSTPLDIAIAVLYVAVVLLAMDFAGREGILVVAAGCAALTVLSYVITHGTIRPAARSCAASSAWRRSRITGAARRAPPGHDRGAARAGEPARPHARHDLRARPRRRHHLLEPRAPTELYGWRREQAIGRSAAELLQTEFPAPLDGRSWPSSMRTGRWEGELVHTDARRQARRRGQPLGAAARRAAAVRSRSSRPTTTSPSATRRRGRRCTAPSSELAHVARVATLGELTASIAHEVNQPLAAVVTNGEACLRWLGRAGARPRPGAQRASSA